MKKISRKKDHRSVVFMKWIALIFACYLVCISGCDAQVYAEENRDTYDETYFSDFHSEELTLYAKSAVILDADTGRILYGKSANTPMANASTTKILTCILAIQMGNPEDIVTVSDYASGMPKVKLGCSSGDQFYLEDLLYSLMLESHNDSAVAIAEAIGGNVESFAILMNEKARELGCESSYFVTPNGLDAHGEGGDHRTTAYDLSKIMAYCVQNPKFLEITQTSARTISTVDGKKSFSLNNHNALLHLLPGTISGKTGFTAKAGYCYVGAYRSENHTYTFALLACGWPNHKDYKWSDAKKLVAYVEDHYSDQKILQERTKKEIELTGAVCVKNEKIIFPETISVETGDREILGFLSKEDQIEVSYDLPEEVEAPIEKGQKAGYEKIYLNHVLYDVREFYVMESAEVFDFPWCVRRVWIQLLL